MVAPEPASIRPLVDSDLEAILDLNNSAVPAVNGLTPAALDWLRSVAHTFVVADGSSERPAPGRS